MQIHALLAGTKIDRREAELLLGYVLKKDIVYLRIHGDATVPLKAQRKFQALLNRRLKHEPISYLIGNQLFLGRTFMVNPHVLIPRPETELLAKLVGQHLKQGRDRTEKDVIVDVGTGSGCLAITLALEFPKAHVIASDVSLKALAVAKKNAKRLKAKVGFIKQNLLTHSSPALISRGRLIIVANLPYLPAKDKKIMMPDVVDYEPASALFAGQDGTTLVRKLLQQIRRFRHNSSVCVFLEIDPPQAVKLKNFSQRLFPEKKSQIKKDLAGKNRFLIII